MAEPKQQEAHSQPQTQNGPQEQIIPGVPLPPAMAEIRTYSADEVYSMLNRVPLFMNELDETDGAGGENLELEALRQLAYEGTRAEIAANFREQGNEAARAKLWVDAKEYYSKAIAALKGPRQSDGNDGAEGPDMDVVELDEVEEAKKERVIEEASHVNRALCHLELKNYRSCNFDCGATLTLNPSNIKAWFRSASACLALDKIPEAEDACARGLEVEASNSSLLALQKKITTRKQQLVKLNADRQAREDRTAKHKAALKQALKLRNTAQRDSDKAPEMEDAIIKLSDPLDPHSTLTIPVLLLYPLTAQSDLIKAFEETHSLLDHLSYILPVPWDEQHEYAIETIDCYMPTPSGGLVKAGKKLPLRKLLESGKVVVVDNMLQIFVVPRVKAAGWIEQHKKMHGHTG